MAETQPISKLNGIRKREGLVPSETPGEWVKPDRGINMNRIKFDSIPIEPVKPKAVLAPAVKDDGVKSRGNDGASESGLFAFSKRQRISRRIKEIVLADRHAIERQGQLKNEAEQLVGAMSKDPGLRNKIEGVVRRLPEEEQAFVARVLREKGDPARQVTQNVSAIRRAEEEKKKLFDGGYAPIGGGLDDSMMVTGDGIQFFVAGMGNGDRDTVPDAIFPFDAIVNGRLKFEVAGRNPGDQRASKRRLSIFPDTVRAIDAMTGKIYELRGVRDADAVINTLLQAAQTITAGEIAEHDTVKLLRDHPEMLE